MKKYKINEEKKLVLTESMIEKIKRYTQAENQCESGGILLGKVRDDYSEYIIEDISEPSIEDKRKRFSFIRNKKTAQKVINRAFQESNGFINYLGEWHTHPEVNPVPSNVDEKLMEQASQETDNAFEILFMVILGQRDSIYVGRKEKNKKLIKMEVLDA